MSDAQTIAVEVVAIEQVTPLIKHFKLAAVDGGDLPAFSGGSHIIVVMRGVRSRAPQPVFAAGLAARARDLRDRRAAHGGIARRLALHARHGPGRQPLEIAHPVNLFALDKIARKHVLIAGGIGITPFLAQLEDLHDGAVPYEIALLGALAGACGIPERCANASASGSTCTTTAKAMSIHFEACCRRNRSARMCTCVDRPE